ncbi:MAG: glycerol-3-phosphate dehydrogenase/oxidase [Gammaproteobacteria bacterium]|nr:glycerol-3-phosphate dehydrogenase/oxidase [Gammaproteobacteria bacterium]
MIKQYEVLIIGGGATGLGCAVESVTRGYQTLLLEAHDYGKGTSSKSTKLVHGGIRYLANFDFALVQEGLEERYYFLKNAPHLARAQTYLIPFHNLFEKIQYHIGIWLYDFLAKKLKIGSSRFLSKREALKEAPDMNPHHICGGGIYYDGQFDDTRMLITLLKTFESLGGVAYNHHPVTEFIEENGKITGVKVGEQCFYAKVIINATGTFTDVLLNLAEPEIPHENVTAAQGTHLVFDREVFDCKHALVIPKTIDGRILFVLPWHNKVLVGTTDIEMKAPSLEPLAQEQEIDLILNTLNQYLTKKVTRQDIRSIFAGQRPLVKPAHAQNTKRISRKHEILMTQNGLISIVGGKWTIYRRMGQDTLDFVIHQGLLKARPSVTQNYPLFGATMTPADYPLSVYGTEIEAIKAIQLEINNDALIHPRLPYFQAEVIYQMRHEQAKTLEDVLARRTRSVFLDADAAIEAAPLVANLMAQYFNQDARWVQIQLEAFYDFAKHFKPAL